MNTEQREVDGPTLGDEAFADWRRRRKRGHDKPGAGTQARDAFRLLHVDNAHDERGTRVPLAEEDVHCTDDGRADGVGSDD